MAMPTPLPLLVLLLSLACGALHAAPPPTEAEREIKALIAAIGDSGCEFERNGNWHAAGEAQAHLRTKYAWLRKRGQAKNAEQFIEHGASASSLSGRNYRVRCPQEPVTESGIWFRAQLTRLRTQPGLPPR